MKKINILLLVMSLGILFSCGGSDDPEGTDPIIDVILPNKPILSLPENGEICSGYIPVSGDKSKAEISLHWGITSYASTYNLDITESGNSVFNRQTSTTSYKVVLDKGKTYFWTVTAKNDDGENISATNSFTTPGEKIGNYVPYAAVINFNIDSTTDIASLNWTGSDEDSDTNELKYNVLITRNDTEMLSIENISETSVEDFNAILNDTFKIEIRTVDTYGSYSTSILNYTYE